MKVIEQLQEILCTVESVEKDVKELRFGCIIRYTFGDKEYDKVTYLCDDDNIGTLDSYYHTSVKEIEIIGNPLSLKHLILFCNNKQICLNITEHGNIHLADMGKEVIIETNITKELYEQEDKVLLDIINFLKGV